MKLRSGMKQRLEGHKNSWRQLQTEICTFAPALDKLSLLFCLFLFFSFMHTWKCIKLHLPGYKIEICL